MVTDAAGMVMFAIRSAVKLGQQARVAYVDATRRRALTLPLPSFFSGTTFIDAGEYFLDQSRGRRFLQDDVPAELRSLSAQRLRLVLDAFRTFRDGGERLSEAQQQELIDFHVVHMNVSRVERPVEGAERGELTDPQAVLALFTVQQWRRGHDPSRSTLQRVAGTLVEIGIDYALDSTNLFDWNSSRGKALAGFLSGLDQIDFAESEVSEIPARLFVATIEAVSSHAELVSGDAKISELVRVSTTALGGAARARITAIDGDPNLDAIGKRRARLDVEDWTELVFRSPLSSGGRLVLADPQRFLGIEEAGREALVASVGGSVLDLVIAEDGVDLQRALSREGLEAVLRSAIETVGEHPEIVSRTDNEGLKALIGSVARDVAGIDGLLERDVLPQVLRLTLARTGENLALLWPDLAGHPERNLLATAAATTLRILSRAPADGERWRPRFRRDDLILVTETVLDELTHNPGWLIDRAGELDDNLATALEAALRVVRARGARELGPGLAADVLRHAVQAVGRRQQWLDVLPDGQQLIEAALDAMLGQIFAPDDAGARWRILREEVIRGAVELGLDRLSTAHVLGEEQVDKLREALEAQIDAEEGKPFDLVVFVADLERRLAA
jgi:hypothetical protein